MKKSALKQLVCRCSLLYMVTIVLFLINSILVCAKTTIKSSDNTFINKKKQVTSKLWSWKLDSLILLHKQTVDLNVQITNPIQEIDSLRSLGDTHFEKGEYHQSVIQYQKAIALAHINHHLIKQVQVMTEISRPLSALGAHNHALNYLWKAWTMVEKTGRRQDKALIFNNAGLIYFCQFNFEYALLFFNNSMDIYEEIGDYSNITFILGGIAHIYLENHQNKKAEVYYNASLKYAKQFKNKKAIAKALCALGNLHSENDQEELAIVYYLESKKLFEQLGEKNDYLRLLHNMAKTYLKQKKIGQALYFAKLNYQMATEQQHLYFTNIAAALLSELYEEIKKPQKALNYYKVSEAAQDSLYSASNKEQLVHIIEKYFFEKKQRQIDSEYQKRLDKKQMQIYLASTIIFFLIVISILLLIYIKQKKKANEMLLLVKKEIEEKNTSLKKSNAFKKQLLSVMAHDIRTPLANAKMILSLFERKHISKQHLQKLIQSSQIEIDSLLMLVDNLLFWITFQLREKQELKSYFSLEEITAQTFFLFRRQATQKGVRLYMQIPSNLEVYGDIESLKIVLRNLVSNAIKFSKHGDMVRVISENNKITNQTIIRIADSGIGMSASDFEYFRNNPGYSQQGTHQEKGTGIGLQLCFQYTSLNDSQLFVQSSPQKGTEFWFSLKGRMIS